MSLLLLSSDTVVLGGLKGGNGLGVESTRGRVDSGIEKGSLVLAWFLRVCAGSDDALCVSITDLDYSAN